MSSQERTLLERAINPTQNNDSENDDDTEAETLIESGDLTAHSTTIGGDEYDLGDTTTGPTFDDSTQGMLDGSHGRPRPREFWTAKQLGQTPPMQLIKITVAQQLTGGNPNVVNPDGELQGASGDLAGLIEDIYRGPHWQEMSFDNLMTATVSDLLDFAWAYWETIPTQGNEFPIAAFKPLPPLQMQHTIDDDTGDLDSDPAFWRVPYKSGGGSISAMGDADALERDRVVVMRDPQSSRSDSLYGESVATKVREWLELIVDVDVHQKRHYSDSELPAGFLHFADAGNVDLQEVENDIVEASGDPHELVTVATGPDGAASWIPVGESVVDLDAIQEQQWYFKLVLAAAGLNANELGVIEGSGFAKETPALQRAIYKKVTKPMLGAIFDPQNTQVVPRIVEAFDTTVDARLKLELERFDPVQEQVERQEMLDEWREKGLSLNELRGGLGREGYDFMLEIPELGGEVNVADVPRYLLDLVLDQSPNVNFENSENGNSGEAGSGPPDFSKHPVLSEREAFLEHGHTYSERAVKQLEDTIDVQSSFIESTAYAEETEFMQITFDAPAGTATYWYGSVPRYRFFNFLRATSKGAYFNKYIRHTGDPGYPFARVS